jgi:fermentation-respiration switch protein FrsA (DUF1100 family)
MPSGSSRVASIGSAAIASGSATTSKEQAAGLYAQKLAEQGLIAIAFDASYQGDSTGEPRQLENPYIRTEDISAVVDSLTTLPYVDRERIGAMGICAAGGYTANVAINGRRIKAVGTVSAVNIGSMFRNGWENTIKSRDVIPRLETGSKARTTEAGGADTVTAPLAPLRREDAPNKRPGSTTTRRAVEHSNAPGFATARSLSQNTYDAFNMAESFLTQPLQIVAGREAGSKWMSDDLYARAASTDKHFHLVEGANHMALDDLPRFVDEAISKLAPFFTDRLRRVTDTPPAMGHAAPQPGEQHEASRQ